MGKFNVFDAKQILTIICGLILGYQNVVAQSGYNYARPDIVVGGGGNDAIGAGRTNIPSSGQTSVRPVPTGFPSAATAGGTAFPTAATGYGAAGTATQPYAGFSAQAQRSPAAIVPTSVAGFAGASAGRPTLQTQRPAGGIFGIGQQYPVTGAGRGGGGGGGTGTGTGTGSSDDDYDGDFSAIPGIPGVNYPIYAQVPPTNFDCAQQPLPGYYSDIEAQCQVFHICALNRTYSFLCPNGTIFSQETLVCVWWNQYDCVSAPSLYANNAFIYDYGSQGPPSNSGGGGGVGAGYQTNVAQVGIIGGAGSSATNRQQQSVFQAQTSSGRTSNSPIGAGIYGGAGTVRPTIASNAFASGGQTAFPGGTSNAAANRFTPGTTAQQTGQATFPTGAPASGGNLFGTPIRNDGYVTGLQDNAFPAAQITSKTTNREYLPPSRRP